MHLPIIDIVILIAYLAATVAFGCWFLRYSRNPQGFTAADSRMPGIVVGLSIFGTYVSSISFLALPGKAYIADWNPFVFSLSLPIAAWIAVRWFVPFYRRIGAISAYHHLESRFGVWARTYAVVCYLLTQIARMGSVMFLLALPLNQLLGWDIVTIILVTGVLTTLYTMVGGIEGVIWTDAVQSVVLIVGALTCAVVIPLRMPEGPMQVFRIAAEHHKFSLGSFSTSLTESTFWVVLVYGLVINLQNFGIDQSYVQRYLTAASDREARKSVWFGALLYVPISAFFFFIGTALFAYYTARPDLLSADSDLVAQVAKGKGDGVFPYFIVHGLPIGMTGLLIAAIFSAAMSTLSSSLNSAATLSLSDVYQRFFRPAASSGRQMMVLYSATIFWGVVGTGAALAMIQARSILDAWWSLAGIFGGGMLGLFLLGFLSRRAGNAAAATGVLCGVTLILWMTLSQMQYWSAATILLFAGHPDLARVLPPMDFWLNLLAVVRSPFHPYLINVFGTLTILLVGFLIMLLVPRFNRRGE